MSQGDLVLLQLMAALTQRTSFATKLEEAVMDVEALGEVCGQMSFVER